MFTKIEIDGQQKIIALTSATGFDQANVELKLNSGGAFQMTDDSGLDRSEFIDLANMAQKIQQIKTEVSNQFVERDELVEVFLLGLCSGEHTFALSPPGTAKTAVASSITASINAKLWRILMNPDLNRDGLVGMIDPFKFQSGEWSRIWGGIATCDVAILDEIWKGSGQNNNILLDVLEERRIREGDDELHIPLLSALSMSNEIPTDSERRAIYDRFLLRLSVKYIQEAGQFQKMLISIATAQNGSGKGATVSIDELRLMAAAAEAVALNPPQMLLDTITELWKEFKDAGISDRRWRKTLKAACAYALMNGRQPSEQDAIVCKWTLWSDPEDEVEYKKIILSKCDPFASEIFNLEALFADLKTEWAKLSIDDLGHAANTGGQTGKLAQRLEKCLEQQIGQYKARIEEILFEVERMEKTINRGEY